ncbi:MAG: amidohydrolase family protein [Phycisphaeraceae bacterium]
MIIDCHTHLNNYHEERVVSIEQCLDRLQQDMAANNVDISLVLSSYKVTDHRPPTAKVVEATRHLDNIFVVAGISIMHYKERDLREISDFLAEGLVKGLKLYPGYEPFYPYDARCKVVYDLAAEYNVPVMIHTGDTYSPKGKVRFSHPLNVDDVAVDNPDVNFIICHIGNPWIRDCMEVVYKNENAYADVSGLVLGNFQEKFERYMHEQVEDMITYAGEPKYLLYGTDWPICEMAPYLKFMRGLDITDKARELIMWRTAARLFKLDVPEAASHDDPS